MRTGPTRSSAQGMSEVAWVGCIDAITPSAVNVTAEPKAKVTDNPSARFAFPCPAPPTYPTIKGMLDSEQGVKEVSAPAIRARSGAR